MDEIRKFPRAILGPGYFLDFRIGGTAFSGLPLVSLGAGGCSGLVPESVLERYQKFKLLEEVHFDCEALPASPFKARVAWVSGWNPACLGMNFLDLPPELAEAVAGLVQGLRQAAPAPAVTGMPVPIRQAGMPGA